MLDDGSLRDARVVLRGDPDPAVATARAYEEAGGDPLLCLVNPYKIPRQRGMQTIELLGKHVIPEFNG